MTRDAARHVVLVTYPGFQILDLAGPHEVFIGANLAGDDRDGAGQAGVDRYRIHVVSNGGGTVASESGLAAFTTDLHGLDVVVDTMLVVGGAGVQQARRDAALVNWVRDTATSARRTGSVCSGAFILGEAGLLDGRRVTTHWARAGQLAREFTSTTVDADPIHVHDTVWTSAGVTAGIDLALALVEEDHGVDCAQTIAQWLVMFLRRPGGQSQFAAPVWDRPPDHDGIRRVVDAVRHDPAGIRSVRSMAAIAAMSERNFTRVFTRTVGVPPGRFLERVRVEEARQLLESSNLTIDSIAGVCGFGTAETMRRSFVRSIGTPPGAYRRRFTHSPETHDRKATA